MFGTIAPRPGKSRRKGWYIPWIFVGCFAVIIGVNAVMVTFATSSWTGLVTRSSFEASNRYNAAIAGQRAQEARGWRHELRFEPAGERDGMLRVELRDRNGAGLAGGTVHVRARRAGTDRHDMRIALDDLGGGAYGAPVRLPVAGRWTFRVLARIGGAPYQDETDEIIR